MAKRVVDTEARNNEKNDDGGGTREQVIINASHYFASGLTFIKWDGNETVVAKNNPQSEYEAKGVNAPNTLFAALLRCVDR